MSVGRTIRLFLVDGAPLGLITAEILNWTGHVLVSPRSRILDALGRIEASRTGVYFLIGEDPEQSYRTKVYIGEGDCIGDRIREHAKDSDKDFWQRMCLVTSKDTNLTKAHARYLEHRLVQMAFESGRANLANSNIPSLKALPESDLADMEYFLIQTQLILPTVGFDFLRPKPSLLVPESSVSRLGGSGGLIGTSPLLKFVNRNGVDASAMDLDGEVVVFKGSHGISQEFTQNDYKNLRDQLIRDGRIMMRADGRIEFQEDVIFHSASAAAAVLANRNSNGLTEWKIAETGQTLKAWRDEQLMAVSLSSSSN